MRMDNDRAYLSARNTDQRGVNPNYITEATRTTDGDLRLAVSGSRDPIFIRQLRPTQAGDQLTAHLLNTIHLGGGTWTSATTVRTVASGARQFLVELEGLAGCTRLHDELLTEVNLWDAIVRAAGNASKRRNLRRFVSGALERWHPNGAALSEALFAYTIPVTKPAVVGYAPDIIDAIEASMKEQVSAWFLRYREAVENAYGTLPQDWLQLKSSALAPQAMTLPEAFEVDESDLVPAIILLAVLDNLGPNLSVIRSFTSDSAEQSSETAGYATGVKARNNQVIRTPAPAGGLFSFVGLLNFITAATTVDRAFRQHSFDFDRLLFIPTGANEVLGEKQIRKWWSSHVAAAADRGGLPDSISFRKLRKGAANRGRSSGQRIIGQSEEMSRIYLADAVPDVIRVPLLLATQDNVAQHWRDRTSLTSADVPDERELDQHERDAKSAIEAADGIMDVGVAACISNGQSPTNPALPCGLGPIACFTCPKGYRTPEVIPGLVAAVEFSSNIRKYEPAEWVDGEAPLLYAFATRSLEQFPKALVDEAPDTAVDNGRALVACAYYETRLRE